MLSFGILNTKNRLFGVIDAFFKLFSQFSFFSKKKIKRKFYTVFRRKTVLLKPFPK